MSFSVPAGLSIQPTPLLQSLLNDAGYTYNNQGQLVPPSARRGMYGTMASEVLNNLLAPYGLKAGEKINLSDNYNILYQSSTGDSGIPRIGQPMGGSPVTDGSMTPDAQSVGTPNYNYYSPPRYTAADVYRPASSLPNLYDMYSPYENINMPFNPFTGLGGYRGQMQRNVTPPTPPVGGGDTPPPGSGGANDSIVLGDYTAQELYDMGFSFRSYGDGRYSIVAPEGLSSDVLSGLPEYLRSGLSTNGMALLDTPSVGSAFYTGYMNYIGQPIPGDDAVGIFPGEGGQTPPAGGGQTPPAGGGQTPPAGGGTTPGGGNPNRIVLPNGNVLIKNPDGSVTILGPDGSVVTPGGIPGGSGTPIRGTPAGGTPAGGTPTGGTPTGGTPAGGTPAGGTPPGGIASLGNTGGGGAPASQATPTWVNPQGNFPSANAVTAGGTPYTQATPTWINPVDPGTVPHTPTTPATPTGTSGTQRTTSSGTVYTQANPVYVNPRTGGAGGGDPLSEIVVTAKRIPTPGDDDDEDLPETMGMFRGGAVRGPRPVDQGMSPELIDRQRAVTQMLARRAAMMQQAAGMQMPQGGSPAQMPQNTALGPQGLPPQMSVPPTPAPQAPVNALASMAPQGQFNPMQQGQFNPMQQGIMGAPQLRGGF